MITEDQAEVIDFLASPATHGGAVVERIDTHTAIVFLAGTRAWKLKRAVVFDYLDFSTVERRRALCEAEVRLNRRTAPTLYRGVTAVTRNAEGSLALGGSGHPIDWVVEMNRFEQEALFDRLASRGRLDPDLMPQLASAIAGFHLTADPRPDHGGKAGMEWVVDGNAAGFAEFGKFLDPAVSERVTADARRAIARHGALLDARRQSGFVRQCHGDLHLRNIVLLEGRPTIFDAIEFNDEIACNDVFYDLAFLLMDLWRRRLPRHANAVWNGYLSETADLNGLPLLPLFLSCRAAVTSQDERHGCIASERPSSPRRAGDAGQRVSDDGGGPAASAAAPSHRRRRTVRLGKVDPGVSSRAFCRGGAGCGCVPQRRNSEAALWSGATRAARSGGVCARDLCPCIRDRGRASEHGHPGRALRDCRCCLRTANRSGSHRASRR